MTRLLFPAVALVAAMHLTATPIAAQTAPVTAEERAAFGAAVRDYLMENPSVIFEAVAEFERRNAQAQSDMDATLVEINADEIFDDGHSWVGGNLDGDLTLVEFMDYKCSYCHRAQPEVMNLLETDGNIRLIIKEFPILSAQSEYMSRFAVSVQQLGDAAHYEQAHLQLMAWEGEFTETSARLMASDLGLDADAIVGHMDSNEVTDILRANRELAQRLQISGTPTFVMGTPSGGELLRGYMPSDEMQGIAARIRG